MIGDPSLGDNLLAFLQALGTHWVALAIAGLLVIEGVFSPFRHDKPPEGRRVAIVAVAGLVLLIAAFQGFTDARVAADKAIQSAESYRAALQTDRSRAGSERDNLAAQLSTLEKQLAESQKQLSETRVTEDGTQQHPFSDKTKCPPGVAVVDSNQATGSSATSAGRQKPCFVALKAGETGGK